MLWKFQRDCRHRFRVIRRTAQRNTALKARLLAQLADTRDMNYSSGRCSPHALHGCGHAPGNRRRQICETIAVAMTENAAVPEVEAGEAGFEGRRVAILSLIHI